MPAPNATGTHGSNRPGPASARTQALTVSMSDGHNPAPGRTTPAVGAACGGQVPACARGRLELRFAIAVAPACRDDAIGCYYRATTGTDGECLIVIPGRERLSASEPGIPVWDDEHIEVPGSQSASAARAPER